jgi:hypothetical protein
MKRLTQLRLNLLNFYVQNVMSEACLKESSNFTAFRNPIRESKDVLRLKRTILRQLTRHMSILQEITGHRSCFATYLTFSILCPLQSSSHEQHANMSIVYCISSTIWNSLKRMLKLISEIQSIRTIILARGLINFWVNAVMLRKLSQQLEGSDQSMYLTDLW